MSFKVVVVRACKSLQCSLTVFISRAPGLSSAAPYKQAVAGLIGGLPLRECGSGHSKGGKRLIGFTIYKFPPQPHDVSAALGTVPFRSNKQYQVSQHLRLPSGGPIYKYTALLFYVSQTHTSGAVFP